MLSPFLGSGSTSMINGKTVIVVLPAYNAAKTLERTISDVPPGIVDEFLLVDDASRDDTVERARGSASPPSSTRRTRATAATRRRATPKRCAGVPTSWSCSIRTISTAPS